MSHFIQNCLILLVLAYVGYSTDFIDCPDGEEGDELGRELICDPPNDTSTTVDCSFIFITDPDNYQGIKCLKITNQGNETVAGFPEIAVGGVGYTYVIGDVYSAPGQGVNYTISTWSIPLETTTEPPTTVEI